MKKINILIVIILVILTSGKAQKVELKLDLKEGTEYYQISDVTMSVSQDYNGMKMDIETTLTGEMSFFVKNKKGTEYNIDVKHKKLEMSMQLPQGKMEFSSENDNPQDIFSLILKEMVNKPFFIRMTDKGKVVEVKNTDTLFNSIYKIMPSTVSDAKKEQIKAQMKKSYGDEAFKGNLEMASAIFPDHPVNIGDKWEIKTELNSTAPSRITTIYEFVEDNTNYYLIKGNGKINSINKDTYFETNGMQMKYDLTGTMTSTMKIEKKTGWIIEATINQDINGKSHIKSNSQMPEGMDIPISIITKMIMTNK